MHGSTWPLVFALLFGAGANSATAAEPRSPQQLVQRLGSVTLRERDDASRQLVELGNAAIPALESGLKHDDAEVRQRCRKILDTVRQVLHEAQLAAFLKHPDRPVALPGWTRFHNLLGNDTAARSLFVDIQRAEPALLREAELDAQRAEQRIDHRCRELYQEMYQANFGRDQQVSADSVAALMFLSTDENLKTSNETISRMQTFAYQQVFRHAALSGPRKDALQALVGAWLEATADQADANAHLRLSMVYGRPQGLPIARRIIKANTAPVDQLAYAILAVGRFGAATDAKLLEDLLIDNRTAQQINRDGRLINAEVRDIAFAVLLHLAGERLADWELGAVVENAETLFALSSIYFTNDAARDRAFDRWKKRRESMN